MAVSRTAWAVRDADAHGREPGRKRAFAALPPSDAPPATTAQQVDSTAGVLARHGMLAWLAPARSWEQQFNAGREHGLCAWDPDRPDQAARAQALAEARAQTIAGVRQDAAKADAGGAHAERVMAHWFWLSDTQWMRLAPLLLTCPLPDPSV